MAGDVRVSEGIPELTIESLLRYSRRELCGIVPVAGVLPWGEMVEAIIWDQRLRMIMKREDLEAE